MTKTTDILDTIDDTETSSDHPETKQMGLLLTWDNYWSIKKLVARASETAGYDISIREYMETNLITPHVAAAREAGLID
jgi:hypothetical protein